MTYAMGVGFYYVIACFLLYFICIELLTLNQSADDMHEKKLKLNLINMLY